MHRENDLPDCVVYSMLKFVRKDLGRKAVEANTTSKVQDKCKKLESFFTSEMVDMSKNAKIGKTSYVQTEKKELVFVNDLSGMIEYICNERGIHPTQAMVRVGIDSGASSLKVVMNILNPENETTENQVAKDSGVNRLIVIAVVQDVQENHSNVKLIIEKVKRIQSNFPSQQTLR